MTGNPSWSALDLDDERLGDECVDIVEKVGVTWINSRLDFYEDYIEKLFRPTGELLAEAPTRVAQMKAEALLVWMAREDLEHMKVPSAQHEQVREAYEHDSKEPPRRAPPATQEQRGTCAPGRPARRACEDPRPAPPGDRPL